MVIYGVCMIICLFIKSGLDNNIFTLSVCMCVCGGGVECCSTPPPPPPPPTPPLAMALYNDAFMIFIPAAPCDTTFFEFYFLKALQNKKSYAMVNHCTSYFLVWDITFKGFAC